MKVTGTFIITCDVCGTIHKFIPNDVDFEAKYGDERQMGEEVGWVWENEFNCDNNKCDNDFEIEYQVWEYPIGAFNHEIINVDGATTRETFQYEFHEPED